MTTEGELQALRSRIEELESERRSRGWLRLLGAASAVLLLVLAGWWTTHVNEVTERKFCAFVAINLAPGAPPTTTRGVQIQAALERLSNELGCRPVPQG